MIPQPEGTVTRENESTRFTPTRTAVLAVFVIPFFAIVLAVVISSVCNMSSDTQAPDASELTLSLAGVHKSYTQTMDVQTGDRTDTDLVSSTGDAQTDGVEPMEVDATAVPAVDTSDDGDRKTQEVGAAPATDTGAVSTTAETTGRKADKQTRSDDVGGVSDKVDVRVDTAEQGKTADDIDSDDVSHEAVPEQRPADAQEDQDDNSEDVSVGDKGSAQEDADEQVTTDDKEMGDICDEENTQETTGDIPESPDKTSGDAGDKDVQDDTDKLGVEESRDEDGAGGEGDMQLSPPEPERTGDVHMDDGSDKDNDNAQQNTEDSLDHDKDGAGNDEAKEADVSTETTETPDNLPRYPSRGREQPTTLAEWGYTFNEAGELRDKKGKPFEFQFYDTHSDNQKRYEAIGELITEYVYELLEEEAQLDRIWLPTDAEEGEARSFFFATKDFDSQDKLLILIHGAGVVRAGQWARRLIINNNIDCGTQLPYIKRGVEEGYGVMVLNTNLNWVVVNGRHVSIRENSSPDKHGLYVWDNFVVNAKAAHIAIVAHSYGGVVTSGLLRQRTAEFQKRVFAIGFTDSVHSVPHHRNCQQFFHENARNWVSSRQPLDTALEDYGDDAPLVSSGHTTHEWTSWSSFESIFDFFADKFKARIDRQSQEENAPLQRDKSPVSDKTLSGHDSL